MPKQPLVTVYDKAGNPEKHSWANARDLINVGYTWKPKEPTTPAALSPHRAKAPPTPKEPAQAVLDGAGHNQERTVEAILANDTEVVDMSDGSGVEVEDDVPVIEPGVEAPAPAAATEVEDETAPTEEASPARRGRPRRAD